ncbi:MAG: hypothetical protein K9J17_14960 [Flavobacteriales bacterium]|nr:hypothetical protein [Flavobacteriales bacterium]
MSKGDKLFRLVHSLELNEKRYFKLQASLQKRESNLARLFDFYVESKEFDEDELRLRFDGEKFLDQLAVTQNHLYELILKSMRSYHLKRSIDFSLQGMLQDVQFLYEKGLFEQSTELLRKVHKVAVKNDRFLIVLSALEWEARMLAEGFYVGKDEFDIDSVSEEFYENLGFLQNEREYTDLQSKIFNNYYKIGIERKNDDYKTNDQIVNQFALKDRNRALTFKSQCCFLNIHAQYNKINGNWEEAYRYRKELFELVDEHFGTNYSGDILKRYFVALNNLIPICIKLKKWEETKSLLDLMDSIEERSLKSHFSEELKHRILIQSAIGRLALYTRIGEMEKGLAIVAEIDLRKGEFVNYHRKYVVLHLYYNIAYFLFTIGQYSPSIRWLNKVLNDTDIKSAEDLHSSTRILTMILQYELGRSELLEYLARSTYRFLNKLEGIYAFEEILLMFMKKASKKKSISDKKEAFRELKEELQTVGYEPGDRNALSTLDIQAWVDSKIMDIPVRQILKEKHSA